jgi:hypothetical protein
MVMTVQIVATAAMVVSQLEPVVKRMVRMDKMEVSQSDLVVTRMEGILH